MIRGARPAPEALTGVHRHNRRRAGLGVDHTDFQHHLDISIAELAAQLLLKQFQVMWACDKLRSRFCSIPAQPAQRYYPSVDIWIAKPGYQGVVIGT